MVMFGLLCGTYGISLGLTVSRQATNCITTTFAALQSACASVSIRSMLHEQLPLDDPNRPVSTGLDCRRHNDHGEAHVMALAAICKVQPAMIWPVLSVFLMVSRGCSTLLQLLESPPT